MRRAVEQVFVGPEDILGAVAVVDVEIDHRDAVRAVLCARVVGGNGGVREQAEAHGAALLGVVARRAHLAEGVRDTAFHHRVHRIEAGADGAERGFEACRRHHRVAVEVDVPALRFRGLRRALDAGDVVLGMGAQDRLFHILAQRRHGPLERVVAFVREDLVDGAHPVRALWMPRPRVVLDKDGVGQEQCRHRGISLERFRSFFLGP